MAVEVTHGDGDGGETEQQLRQQNEQNGDVADGGGGADAGIEQAPVREKGDADEAEEAGDATDPDRQQLLETMGDADGIENPDRREQADEMAEEDHQNADVKQVRAPHQLTPPQQLAGACLPGVLLAIEAQQAAEQEHG